MRENFLNSAINYSSKLGWWVHPIHTLVNGRCSCGKDCGRSSCKHPKTPHGLKDATKDRMQIEEWVRRFGNDSNIAVATEPSELFVLDVDVEKGGFESLKELESIHGELPLTVTQKTGGGGVQYFFKRPAGGAPSIVAFKSGLDISSNRPLTTADDYKRLQLGLSRREKAGIQK